MLFDSATSGATGYIPLFVFDLVSNVIKEKAVYYDFARIEAMGEIREKERKLYRLLFSVM